MAKIISQETFDDVVKENIIEFSMDVAEAQDETVKQFQAQGINLANIIVDLKMNEETGRPVLNETVEQLKAFERTADNDGELLQLLDTLTAECKTSVPHRVMAAKLGANEQVQSIIETELSRDDTKVLKTALLAWNEMISKQPDIFDDKSMYVVLQLLEKSDELVVLALQHLKNATVMHEINRQNIMNANILPPLKRLLSGHSNEVLKETCSSFRSLILDDDVRCEFSKAHEHARTIAAEVLDDLANLLPAKSDDHLVFSELLLTIAALTVRHELCARVEEIGGVKHIYDGMQTHSDSVRVQKEALKLLRALAGNDAVKSYILKNDAPKLIDDIINLHKNNDTFAKVALACIATLTLRSKENSELLFEEGIAETIVETMRLHPKNKMVQRNGSWAIRNMVSRSRNQCPAFLSFGAEEIIQTAMTNYPDIEYDLKSALRDLGCNVQLREEWTGVKNKLNIED